jgi:signal peptidase II
VTGGEVAPAGPATDVTPGRPTRRHWLLFAGLTAAVVAVDQATKAWITANVSQGEIVPVVGDLLRITYSANNGAIFGLFRDQALIFALVSIGVLGLIVWFEARAGSSLLITVALGLLLGGAIGNLIDRLRLGYVVDWVDMGIGDWRFYTYNVADAAISTALFLLILSAILPLRRPFGQPRGSDV